MCKTETIRGLHVKDYHDLGIQALEETIKLDEQLTEQLMKLRDFLEEEDYERLKYNLDCLIIDTSDHRDYCVECQGDIIADMEHTVEHFEDYMNPPIEENEITICREAHPVRNGDCAMCNEVCCPMSDVNNQ